MCRRQTYANRFGVSVALFELYRTMCLVQSELLLRTIGPDGCQIAQWANYTEVSLEMYLQ